MRWHQSSEQSRRGFCARCGTTMFYTSVLSPGEIHIARANIDGPIDREPGAHLMGPYRWMWSASGNSGAWSNRSAG